MFGPLVCDYDRGVFMCVMQIMVVHTVLYLRLHKSACLSDLVIFGIGYSICNYNMLLHSFCSSDVDYLVRIV